MVFGFNKKKNQDVIVKELQGEDDVFHRTIIALERLEQNLIHSNGKTDIDLKQTAVGSSRDHHKNSLEDSSIRWFLELKLQCKTIYMNSNYTNPDFFKIAVEAFLSDFLEWYGGRLLLDYFDAVDTTAIPILAAITHTTAETDNLFEKYVCETPKLCDASLEQKYKATEAGTKAWIEAQHILYEERNTISPIQEDKIITKHTRGTALDGYKRLISALSSMCTDSAPLKMLIKLVGIYLPTVAAELPTINEEAIDKMYTLRLQSSNENLDSANNELVESSNMIDDENGYFNDPFEDQALNSDQSKLLTEPENQPAKESTDTISDMEDRSRDLEKDQIYSRIMELADEIISLVRSLNK